ncbi:formyltetrahydrofolate deformylase [Costertonia aggregata]|uniref:Formyltetrahydrofolate deformylase n=1 Tax=Costertonia aggregata TaxID=343403 RepID=A0A7H9AMY3_9FLAO|nr:formyltetrahydrofolate deformylase [Costertonia aggregata]QLG44777.1 formyltetrahydrofolate deformylase [Costertonia aggregata]
MNPQIVTFLIKCPDKKGIISALTGFFFKEGFNIISAQQYTNSLEGKFFMRIRLTSDDSVAISKNQLENKFSDLAKSYQITWKVDYGSKKQKVAILVSHTSHNLYDLLYRHREGELNCDVRMVISNHQKLKSVADMFGVPFHYAPVTAETKSEQENELTRLLDSHKIDLIVMARYMQILSAGFIDRYQGKIINIHHSFLPAFQGANPYKRAYERGVKLIGATAHYATKDLDEGPIIEQGVERVTHECTPASLKKIGADIETLVLAKAVNFHLNNQVIVDGNKAIVFPETGE